MSDEHSISQWIEGAKLGDSLALQNIWAGYYAKIVRQANNGLQGNAGRVSDGEDVATSVFESFFRAAQENRFPDLADRTQLWQLLLRMTERKLIDYRRRQQRQKRGSGKQRGESAFAIPGAGNRGIENVPGNEPGPDLVILLRDLLSNLADEELQAIAVAKLKGYENAEIAKQLDCSTSTIERRLRLIRKKWSILAEP